MKIFFDTNVIISSFITHGSAAEVFEYCIINHEVLTSSFVISEFREKLHSKFGYKKEEIIDAINFIGNNFKIIIHYENLSEQFCKDKDDDNIIAAALAAKVDCIITGDSELLSLKIFKDIYVISPRDFWKFELNFFKNHKRT
jgi:putative PIN family toxin of toxin-antitoxin system